MCINYTMCLLQMTWQPYTAYIESGQVGHGCPPLCPPLWRARIALVFFNTSTWIYPDRVMRQFGLRQGIPEPIIGATFVHYNDSRRSDPISSAHVTEREIWDYYRLGHVVNESSSATPIDEYMAWFRANTRMRIGVRISAAQQEPHHGRYQPTGPLLQAAVCVVYFFFIYLTILCSIMSTPNVLICLYMTG